MSNSRMNFGWFASVLVHHPVVVLSAVAIFSGTCIIIPLTLKSVTLPTFKDPQLGFSTRGTKIANRLTTWTNLMKSTSPSGQFTTNPKEYLYIKNKNKITQPPKTRTTAKPKPKKHRKPKRPKEPIFGSETLYEDSNSSNAIAELNRWKAVQNLTPNPHKNFERNDENFFCGSPDEQYAHFVVSTHNKRDLFNINDLLTMCKLEHELIDLNYYEDLCIQNNNQKCCKHWSLPNYVAFLNKRASCLAITAQDVETTKKLLIRCSPYFHSFELNSQCLIDAPCCEAPIECLRHDAVFNVLNFITSTSFLAPNATLDVRVRETMVFLPLACSTAIMPYYHEMEKLEFDLDGIKIVAMEFGIKNALFDEFLLRDTYLMGSGTLFVFLCIWIYTESLFLTMMTIIVIVLSLAISYFMYNLVFEIKFFPFMNLLATIVAIGIGSDDAFIFCKIWHIQKQEPNGTLLKVMTDTFHHAFMSMFVTALTTSVAFLGSYVSSVTAVSCFSIFAGMAVFVNYCLMMTWFPACLVIWERSCLSNEALFKSCCVMCYQRWCCIKLQLNLSAGWCQYLSINRFFKARENLILDFIIKLKYFWFLSLVTLAVLSGFVVFVYPKIQLPDTNEFQLFVDSHPFEQYDFKYKNHFWFTRPEKNDQVNYKLPLRFVWGALPIDNGDYLDPTNLGTLTPDPDFDMSDPESQKWLLNFCQEIREQPFYQSMIGPLLPNCFVETFMKSMNRKCYDPFLDQDRTPCCETAKFPFNRTVFNECIIDEIADIYNTPSNLVNPGMAGPKFSKDQNPTIKIVIIEYDSSYSYSMSFEQMDSFFKTVEGWMTKKLETAPKSMKNGWFISEFGFYDLQRELTASTQTAILISMGLAFIVLFLSTLNILTSLYAILTITSSISVTMAVLVLLGWKLNILESTAVSTAIGLTVDFSLHYSVNYRLCPESIAVDREAATRFALNYMAGPAFMAAITTGAAGAFMLPSLILPYIQIGIFLVLVMAVSWVYATFMLGSMLAISGPIKGWGQFHYPNFLCMFGRPNRAEELPLPQTSTLPDCHELESLTFPTLDIDIASPKELRRSLSASGASRFTPSKYVFTDQSPSATSAITIIMADDN